MEMVFDTPKRERSINHEYKKVVVEEVFSDLSLTKILITTANRRASTHPLIFFDVKKPNIFYSLNFNNKITIKNLSFFDFDNFKFLNFFILKYLSAII